jgi:hypothetical protein
MDLVGGRWTVVLLLLLLLLLLYTIFIKGVKLTASPIHGFKGHCHNQVPRTPEEIHVIPIFNKYSDVNGSEASFVGKIGDSIKRCICICVSNRDQIRNSG